jgi:hypothetical protein
MNSKAAAKQEKEWRKESDAEALQRAAEIQADRERFKGASAVLRRKAEAMNRALRYSSKKR